VRGGQRSSSWQGHSYNATPSELPRAGGQPPSQLPRNGADGAQLRSDVSPRRRCRGRARTQLAVAIGSDMARPVDLQLADYSSTPAPRARHDATTSATSSGVKCVVSARWIRRGQRRRNLRVRRSTLAPADALWSAMSAVSAAAGYVLLQAPPARGNSRFGPRRRGSPARRATRRGAVVVDLARRASTRARTSIGAARVSSQPCDSGVRTRSAQREDLQPGVVE